MAESLAESYARNLAEQIKRAAGDEYAQWALQARSQYITLRLAQDREIRKLYYRATETAARLLGQRNRWSSDEVLRNRLNHIINDLNEIADDLDKSFEELLKRDLKKAVETGAAYSQAITLKLIGGSRISAEEVMRIFARVNQQAVEACWARTKNGLFLSDRIWQQGDKLRRAMREIVQNGVAVGMDAKEVARALEQYVRSDAATFAKQYPNMMKRMGKRIPKNLTYEALRLARTEMTAAFGEGTIAAARVSPSYRGMKWILSKAHPLEDVCDTLALADSAGLGAGVYAPGNEPLYPAHPNCLCVLVPVHEPPEEFVKRLRRWQDDPTAEPELENWYNEVYSLRGAPPGTKPRDTQPQQVTRPELYVELDDLPEEARLGLVSAWETARNHGLANGTETILHVSAKTGKQVVDQEFGDRSSVTFSDGLRSFLATAEPDSIVSIHNHPSSSSFSSADLTVASTYPSIKYLTVIGHDRTRYVVRVGKGERPTHIDIGVAYIHARDKYRPEYVSLVKSGTMTEDAAWRECSHRIMQDVAKRFGWTYRRIGPDGKEN